MCDECLVLRREIAALRGQLKAAQQWNARFCAAIGPMDEFDTYEDAIARIAALKEENEKMRKAIQVIPDQVESLVPLSTVNASYRAGYRSACATLRSRIAELGGSD
jgi:hypothetical protein